MEENRRVQRVAKEIRDLIATYVVHNLGSELEGISSITRVIVSKDLRTAKALVYNQLGVKASEQNAVVMRGHAPQIQKYINSSIRMKYCPKVQFHVDDKFEDALRVQEELRKLELERIEKEKAANAKE